MLLASNEDILAPFPDIPPLALIVLATMEVILAAAAAIEFADSNPLTEVLFTAKDTISSIVVLPDAMPLITTFEDLDVVFCAARVLNSRADTSAYEVPSYATAECLRIVELAATADLEALVPSALLPEINAVASNTEASRPALLESGFPI